MPGARLNGAIWASRDKRGSEGREEEARGSEQEGERESGIGR